MTDTKHMIISYINFEVILIPEIGKGLGSLNRIDDLKLTILDIAYFDELMP